jgi:hypothetical protein
MKLNVFGKIYSVKFCDLSKEDIVARVHTDKGLMEIHNKLTPQMQDECFIHEIVHAALARVGFKCTSINKDVEELICEAVAKSISENFTLKVRK